MNNEVLGDRRFYISFTREEITHVQMSMELLEQDYNKLKAMKTDKEIEAFINAKQETVSYSPGNVDTFYEWHSGKESTEGEGDKGLFDFSLEDWVQGSCVYATYLSSEYRREILCL